jgi:hypothetical protein
MSNADQGRTKKWYRQYTRRRRGSIPHGTQNGYANWACRCTRCREAHREHVQEWRARGARA